MEHKREASDRIIRCECVNCKYHTREDSCRADSITVGSRDAVRCGETCCETFSGGGALKF